MKRIGIVVLALVYILGLASCGIKPPRECSESVEPPTEKTNTAIDLNQASNVREPSMGLHVVTTEYGLLGTTICSDNYAVEIDTVPTGGVFLNIFDFATMKKTTFGDPYHAFITDVLGGVTPIIVNGETYIIKHGMPSMEDFDGSDPSIIKVSHDGEQTVVCNLSSNEIFDLGIILADEENNLYFLEQEFNRPQEEGIIGTNLVKYNLDTGDGVILRSWDRYQSVSISGATSNGIVIQSQGLLFDPDAELSIFFPASGRYLKDLVSFVEGEITYSVDNVANMIYLYNSKDDSLQQIDVCSMESKTYIDHFSETINKNNIILFGNVFDGIIPLFVGEDMDYSGYSIADDCLLTPNLKYYVMDVDERNVRIIGESKDCYFVVNGISLSSYTYYDSEGNYMYTSERGFRSFALINKDDYWNGKAVFKQFN